MANLIEIIIKATDQASKTVQGVGKEMGSMGKFTNDVVKDLTGFNVTTLTVAGAVAFLGKQVIDATKQTQDYNLSIIDLARDMGTTTAEASELFQVSDDLRLSTSTLTTAFKTMTDNGLQPNIDTLAKLADQYVAIQDPVQRAQFAADEFGKRAGPEMKKLLEQGGSGIKSMVDSVGKGLIVTNKAAKASEDYYKAVDALNDKWTEYKMIVGNQVIPVITDMIDGEGEGTKGLQEQAGAIENLIEKTRGYPQAQKDLENQLHQLHEAIKDTNDGMIDYSKSELDAANAANQMQSSLETMKAVMAGSYGDMQTKYSEAQQTLNDKAQEYLDKIKELEKKPYLSDDQKKDLDEAKKGWQDTAAEIKNNADEHDKETKKFVVDMLIKRLSLDGFSAKDSEFIGRLMEDWGLVDKQTADLIKSADAYNTKLNDGTTNASNLADQIAGIPTEKTVTVTTVHKVVNSGGYVPGNNGGNPIWFAKGGDYDAGRPRIVGENGPELDVPDHSGRIIPNDKLGGLGANITIHLHVNSLVNSLDQRGAVNALKPVLMQALREINR
jgi:hypothetical protein